MRICFDQVSLEQNLFDQIAVGLFLFNQIRFEKVCLGLIILIQIWKHTFKTDNKSKTQYKTKRNVKDMFSDFLLRIPVLGV